MDTTTVKARAKAIDRALKTLEAAVGQYAEECRKLDSAYRDGQKAKPRWPGRRSRYIQPHPLYEVPLQHVKAAMSAMPNLQKSLNLFPSRGRTVESLHEEKS